ncbi:MAG: radical SAM protein [Candidatus Cloacimonetes bacterium]|nr:radical SAM protein [Candidatus Cloacimonadota bacterium]
MATGYIFDIKRFSVHDGPGIRTTVFFMGCPLRCKWCHNPESRLMEPFQYIKSITLSSGESIYETKTLGYKITAKDLMKEILEDKAYFDNSGGGVTFSGGEPLKQPEFLKECLQLCYVNGIHTTLDTSGYAEWAIFQDILNNIDLILYDIKSLHKHRQYTGADIKLIRSNLEKLAGSGVKLQIRIPLIAEVNGNEIDEFIEYFLRVGVKSIALLPYHNLAKNKGERFGLQLTKEKFSCPTEFLDNCILKFKQAGFQVSVGG